MRKNSSDNIYEAIKNSILLGELNFGDKIVEVDYATKLNVSRTPLREAIKKLEIEGIIERLSNGRLKIMDLTSEKIDEIFDIRIALEGILFESIVKNKIGLEKIFHNLLLTKYYIDMGKLIEAKELFFEYNSLVYSISSLEFAVKVLKHYDFIISILKRKSLQENSRIIEAYNEHQEVINFLKNNDLEAAKERNRIHLLNAKNTLKKYV